jgi:hypothetical protein
MFGRSPVYAQNTSWVRALEQAHYNGGYVPTSGGFIGSKRNCPKGIGGKRCQEDGDDCSLHNYGLAWDIEYQYNPHVKRKIDVAELWELFDAGVTKYNPNIVAVIEAVRTTGGVQAFTWLGYSLGDFMHWQVNFPPEDQEIDWTTVDTTEEEDNDMPPLEIFLAYVRKVDIEKMGKDKIITDAEVNYFTTFPMWSNDDPSELQPDVNSADWANLYNAYRTRAPIWAV